MGDRTIPQPGQEFGNYYLRETIAQSGSAWLFRATTADAAEVVLKITKPTADAFAILRLYQQARLGMRLQHEHLAAAIEVGKIAGRHCLVQEFCEGKNLWKHSIQKPKHELNAAIRITVAVATALDTLHAAGFVHRAVTPDHVLLGEPQIKLLGLGYVAEQQTGKHYRNVPLKNDWALAPEARDYPRKATTLADIYSLGAQLLYLLSGIYLPAEVDAREIARRLGECDFPHGDQQRTALVELLARTLSTKRRERPRSAWQFAQLACQTAQCELHQWWSTPPLAVDSSAEISNEERWFVLKDRPTGERQLLRGNWAQVMRLLQHGRLSGHELATQSLGDSFRPLVEFPEFATLEPGRQCG